jgi:hypothetical protein
MEKLMAPFLTIVTRCCHRPKMLAVNIRSVLTQTNRSVEQIFIVDEVKRGLKLANKSLYENRDRISGEWVYILDDDTKLISPKFVASLRTVAKNADVIMVKSSRPQLAPHTLPKPDVWRNPDRLRISSTNCLCYVVRRELWQRHIYHFGRRAAGDWWFLKAVAGARPRFAWLDMIAAETQQLGRAHKFENCSAGWWKQTVKRFSLEQGPQGWHLPLHERKPKPKRRKPKPKERPAAPVPKKKPKRRRRKPPPAKRAPIQQQSKTPLPVERQSRTPPPINRAARHVILGRRGAR